MLQDKSKTRSRIPVLGMSSYGRVFTAPVGGVDKDIDNVGVRRLVMNHEFSDFVDNCLRLIAAVIFYGCMFGGVYFFGLYLRDK